MDKKQQTEVKKVIQGICSFYGQKPRVSFSLAPDFDSEVTEINIEVTDGSALIGSEGENLMALQHLLRVILHCKKGQFIPRFLLDVNNYRRERREYLRELAKETAERVSQENRLVVLRPMNAFERRLIHIALAADSRVMTESLGQERERRVIVKPS